MSKQTNTPINTIRYFERIGLIPQVKKNHDGLREFTEDDAGWICFIKQMRGWSFCRRIDRICNIIESTRKNSPS